MPNDEQYLHDLSSDADRQNLVGLAKHGIPWNIAMALAPDKRASWLVDIEQALGQFENTDRQQT
jgi:hypothetical protein